MTTTKISVRLLRMLSKNSRLATYKPVLCSRNGTQDLASHRHFTTSAAVNISSLETVSRCPDPACACAAMPPDMDIDRSSPLTGTMVTYDEHVVIRTGVNDWTSRIENDDRFPLVKILKQKLGRGGEFHDPFTNNMLTTSSSPSSSPSILLFPSFRAIPYLPATTTSDEADSATKIDSLIRGFLLAESPTSPPRAQFETSKQPQSTDPAASDTNIAPTQLLRDPAATAALQHHDVTHLTVLICGHDARDSRCGVLGPLLAAQFEEVLCGRKEWLRADGGDGVTNAEEKSVAIEMISHIGGHKFAGNVILYIPRVGAWEGHPLAGKGVWYGRVEPRHVEGIVEETVEKGVVIKELFRGGIGKGKEMFRLD